ncbi:hypothetical protein BJ742DRAFT_836105 [Cladochytrium replicatum]|nr:hypothetical protein BJ742DRAFT_836105 [Cladochytrium replicatum]
MALVMRNLRPGELRAAGRAFSIRSYSRAASISSPCPVIDLPSPLTPNHLTPSLQSELANLDSSPRTQCIVAHISGANAPAAHTENNSRAQLQSLSHTIATLDTPLISILSGSVSSAAASIYLHSPLRITTESARFSLEPSTPLSGGLSFSLAHLPDGPSLGAYFSVLGYSLQDIELILGGFGTHFIPEERIPALLDKLKGLQSSDLRWLNQIADDFVGGAPAKDQWDEWKYGATLHKINRCFTGKTFGTVLRQLEKEGSEWATSTLEVIHKHDLRTSAINYMIVQKCYNEMLDFAGVMHMEHRLAELLKDADDSVTSKNIDLWSENAIQRLSTPGSNELQLPNSKTFRHYVHRTVTSVVASDDVRDIVTGANKAAGEMALTSDEVISWFRENWGTFLDSDDLDALIIDRTIDTGGRKYVADARGAGKDDPAEPRSPRGRRVETWGLVPRIESIIARSCTADKNGYLRWTS